MEGYTTGTHTSAIFKTALKILINKEPNKSNISKVKMPNANYANILIDKITISNDTISVRTKKTHNEDIDVTKGAYISCHISTSHKKDKLSTVNHIPHTIIINNTTIFIYAGKGLGIVKRKGLKVKPNYPAINPVPLNSIKLIAEKLLENTKTKQNIYSYIEVHDGEKLAEKTANPKIGIVGGISIIGTTGIVKPISNEAYIKTIETFINVAEQSRCSSIIFTLGNSAYKEARKRFTKSNEMIIEIGNFIYSSLSLLKNKPFLELYLLISIGKMIKLMQGNKNTHSHYGNIDMNKLIKDLNKLYPAAKTIPKEINTSKELIEKLETINLKNKFYDFVCSNALNTLITWKEELKINLKSVHIILITEQKSIIKNSKNTK